MIAIAPSSVPRIPQSVARLSSEGWSKRPSSYSLQVTPTRKSGPASQQTDAYLGERIADQGGFLPLSPLHQRHSSPQQFNAIPESALKMASKSVIEHGIQDTPIKKGTGITHSHPCMTTSGVEKENANGSKETGLTKAVTMLQEDSIYKSLGWDDVDELA